MSGKVTSWRRRHSNHIIHKWRQMMVTSSMASGSSRKASSCDWLPAYRLLLSTTDDTLPTRSYSPDLSNRRRRSTYLATVERTRPPARQMIGVTMVATTRAMAPYNKRVVTDGPDGGFRLGNRRTAVPDELWTQHIDKWLHLSQYQTKDLSVSSTGHMTSLANSNERHFTITASTDNAYPSTQGYKIIMQRAYTWSSLPTADENQLSRRKQLYMTNIIQFWIMYA